MSEFIVQRHVWNVEGYCEDTDECGWSADGEIAGDWSVEDQCKNHAAETGHEVNYTEAYTFTGKKPANPNEGSQGD